MYYSLAFIFVVLYSLQSLHCQEREEIQGHPVTCPRSMACKQVAEPDPNPGHPEGPGAPAVLGRTSGSGPSLLSGLLIPPTSPVPHRVHSASLCDGWNAPAGNVPRTGGQGSTDLEPEGLA